MFVLLLSLAILFVPGQCSDQEDEALRQHVEILTEKMEMLEVSAVVLAFRIVLFLIHSSVNFLSSCLMLPLAKLYHSLS